MISFEVGQRWVSQTEAKLGLGIVTDITNRRVVISFPAAGENRTYAIDNAPLSRVIYKVGDTISNHDEDRFRVVEIDQSGHVVFYLVEALVDDPKTSGTRRISEVELNCFIQFTSPLQRLVSGHFDRNRAFRLRYRTLMQKDRLQRSQVKGLLGSRTSLLPHQVYIADKVSRRFAPRVLLADEVGLGKTIEAGMIIHAQLFKGMASRVLIVVPESLLHQWLVEMLRRFNLRFSIFDQERYQSLLDEGISNPFESEQLILCKQDFICGDNAVCQHACEAGWDILTVDEAHHLRWSETEVSPEYRCVENLSQASQGVLLLTATPEQVGIESHFARLRLLDPARFGDLKQFKLDEENYARLNQQVSLIQQNMETANRVDSHAPLDPETRTLINELLGQEHGLDFDQPAHIVGNTAIQQLLDQQGTSRVMFRNTRHTVQDFPQRKPHFYALPAATADENPEGEFSIDDPRVDWLCNQLKQLKQEKSEKVLLICHSQSLAIELEAYLKLKQGFRTGVFHEGLSIIERDRIAAYFADREEGAQILVCSEIGSEGRNFQFAHHLILFDLPQNPDLLEQRIGRLDRIGQKEEIQIHIPYLESSRQEGLMHWYQDGLDAFRHSCAAGYAIYEHFSEQLEQHLNQGDFRSEIFGNFISGVRQFRDQAMAELHSGKDPLLELNSCDPEKARQLIEQIEVEEQSKALDDYMSLAFDLYGVNMELQSDQTIVIHPGDHMLTESFPGLSEDGKTLSYHRFKALVREDVDFFTWEHPMVEETMEMVLSSELGNAGVTTFSINSIKAGTLFLEAVFVINCMAPKHLQLEQFLPLSPQRLVVDISGRNLSELLPHDKINELSKGIKRSMAQALIKQIHEDVSTMHQHARKLAEQQLPGLLDGAKQSLKDQLEAEVHRMQSLQKHNPLIRDEEIDYLRQQLEASQAALENSQLELQAMRVIVNA